MARIKVLETDYKVASYLALRTAREYCKGAEILNDAGLTFPVMVNLAFSCELYMKALLMWQAQNQQVIDQHELVELFQRLPQSMQESLRGEHGTERWECCLKDSSDAFRQWRYFYEKDRVMHGHIGWLFSFAEKLDQICAENILIEEVLRDE